MLGSGKRVPRKAKQRKKFNEAKPKSNEWALGQPLFFPMKRKSTQANLLAREVLDPANEERLKPIKRPHG